MARKRIIDMDEAEIIRTSRIFDRTPLEIRKIINKEIQKERIKKINKIKNNGI